MADPVTIGIELALFAAEMALTASQKIKGPRLDDLSVSVADYGTPIPRFWGIRRLQPQIIWAEKLREKKVTSKTKGGKYTQYKYYGTWAVLICDHPIDAVTRIWFDKRLVLDRTHSGPISLASLLDKDNIKLADGVNMRVYLGSADQLPDPRMTAWCEDRYGADSCPAYRGSAYIVFEDIPLEQVGNRIPQLTVEAVNGKTSAHPYEDLTTAQSPGAGFAFDPTGQWMAYWHEAGGLEWWDVASRTRIGSSFGGAMTGTMSTVAMAPDGIAYFVADYQEGASAVPYLVSIAPLGAPIKTPTSGVSNLQFGTSRYVGGAVYTTYDSAAGYIAGSTHVGGDSARDFCEDGNGDVWMLSQPTGASSAFTLTNLTSGVSHSFTGTARSGPTDAYFCHAAAYGHFYVATDGHFYFIEDSGFTVTSSGVAAFSDAVAGNNAEQNPNLKYIWTTGFSQYSLADGALVQTLDPGDWVASYSYAEKGYDPVSDAMWCRTSGSSSTTLRVLYFGRIGSNGVSLQTIVDDVSDWCGLTGQDSAALTQNVLGYSVTQGTGKDMIAPLLDIHDVDARPHDFTVQFVNRGAAPSGPTLPTADFVRDPERYTVTIAQDTDLPRRVTFNFADNAKDQQANTAIAQRPLDATDATREQTIDLSTYADTADGAQQKADRYFRRQWNERERPKLSLTAQHLALEPGDVKTVSLDGSERTVRLDKLTRSQGALKCEFVRDDPALAVLNPATTGAPMDGRDPETILIPAITRGFILDIPLVKDADNAINPLLYVAAGGYSDPWPGAFVYRGDDGTYDDQFAALDTSAEATWGLSSTTLQDAIPELWDRGNSVNVKLLHGTLTSHTEAEIDADPSLNLAAIGSASVGYEMIQFATATLQSDGSYTLAGFKRGRRGTAATSHSAASEFLLLDQAVPEQLGAGDVGGRLSFKAATAGRSIDSSVAIDIAPFTGASLKPYAPARIRWTSDGTDLTGTITRRTRVGGAWVGGGTIPLGEASEAYEVEIYHGGVLKRTIAVSGTNSFTYAGADIAADGNSVGVAPACTVYQMSDVVGRGFALAA